MIPVSNPLTLTLSPTLNPLPLSGLTGASVLVPGPGLNFVDVFSIMGQVSASSQHSLKFKSSVLEHLKREYKIQGYYGTSRPIFLVTQIATKFGFQDDIFFEHQFTLNGFLNYLNVDIF